MNSAILVAAGKGVRMGSGLDKMLLPLAGRPLIVHTWQRFDQAPSIDEIVVVVREGRQAEFAALATQFGFEKPFRIVAGGAERQDSVWNGLLALVPSAEVVAIQDGARPCTPPGLIAATIEAALATGAAVAAQRVTDTIKEADGSRRIARTLDRERLWSVQTPQTFRVAVIRRALAEVRRQNRHITDDTAACELIGQPVQLVECLAPNPKATSPADLPYLESLLCHG